MVDIASIINTHFENILLGSIVVIVILIIMGLSSGSVSGAGGYTTLISSIFIGAAAITVGVLHKFPKIIPASLGGPAV